MKRRSASENAVRFLFMMVAVLSLLMFRKADANAAGMENVTWPVNGSTVIRKDVNGDGRKETIKFSVTKLDTYYYNKIRVYINGKKALEKSIKGCSGGSIRYLSCSKKRNYLQIQGFADGGFMAMNKIYYISGSSLTEAADLGRADNMSAEVRKVTSSSITVRFSVQPWETGRVQWDFVYTPKGRKLKLKSNTAKVSSVLGGFAVNDAYTKYFKRNQFVAARARTFYTSSSLKKKAFTVKEGDVLTLSKVKIVGKKMYLSFKKSGKTGWCRIKSKYDPNGYWFYGVSNRLAG